MYGIKIIRISIHLVVILFLLACAEDKATPRNAPESAVMPNAEELIEDFSELEDEEIRNEVLLPAHDIKSQLEFLSQYNYDDNPDANMDSLCSTLSEKITKYLKHRVLSKFEVDSIGLKICINEPNLRSLKFYNFDYHCGGTRGYISHPIIQWVSDSGELCSYNLSKNIECYFGEIYRLRSDYGEHYVLLGQETGSGACIQNMVYCIEIKDRVLFAEPIMFVNRPYINLCNITFTFDENKQLLIGTDEMEMSDDLSARAKAQGVYSESESDNEDLVELLNGLYSEHKSIRLVFDGREFTKSYDY